MAHQYGRSGALVMLAASCTFSHESLSQCLNMGSGILRADGRAAQISMLGIGSNLCRRLKVQSESEYFYPPKGSFIVRVMVSYCEEDTEGPRIFDSVSNELVNDSRGIFAREALEAVARKAFEGAGVKLYQPGLFQTHDSES